MSERRLGGKNAIQCNEQTDYFPKLQEDSLGRELRFPAGMRVLVVDDDPTCLKMMDQLLRKCQYLVTTTNRAKEALRILKEGKNRYDIVISDVVMPDMDGLKLLQLIGLEMSIPVIILSAYSDTKRVMQGIKNGACDYLVKPVRIQELQNIWQHVVRRNKTVTLRKTTPAPAPSLSLLEDAQNDNVNAERLNGNLNGDYDNNDDDDDDDEQEDSGNENEETGNQKKPRLFWSVELHQKFVNAVESLGIDKAFPKKILDLMNVEGLTREKVASHLQKYRLYLRKLNNNGASQTSSKISAYDNANIGPLGGGYGVFRSLAGTPSNFQGLNPSLSNPPLFGRFNAAAGMSIRGIASSPMLQPPQLTNSSSFPPFAKFDPPPNPNQNLNNGASLLYPPPNSITPSEYPNQSFSNITGFDGNGLLDPNRCPPTWGSLVPPQGFQHNSFISNISDNGIMANFPNGKNNDPLDYNCGFPTVDSFNGNIQTQDGVNGNGLNSFSYFGQSHMWQDQRPDNNTIINSFNMAGGSSSLTPVEQNNNFTHLESASSQFGQQPNMKCDDFLVEEAKVTGGGSEYLEDIVEKFLNKDNGETAQMGGDFDLDSFSI